MPRSHRVLLPMWVHACGWSRSGVVRSDFLRGVTLFVRLAAGVGIVSREVPRVPDGWASRSGGRLSAVCRPLIRVSRCVRLGC
jgi:hypothetical protein